MNRLINTRKFVAIILFISLCIELLGITPGSLINQVSAEMSKTNDQETVEVVDYNPKEALSPIDEKDIDEKGSIVPEEPIFKFIPDLFKGNISEFKKINYSIQAASEPIPDPNLLKAVNNINIRSNTAPYSISSVNENISTLSGSVSTTSTDLTLPGRNGLSFSLKRIYDSNNADFYEKEFEAVHYCECIVAFNARRFLEKMEISTGRIYVDSTSNSTGVFNLNVANTGEFMGNFTDAIAMHAYVLGLAGKPRGMVSDWSEVKAGVITRSVTEVAPNPQMGFGNKSLIDHYWFRNKAKEKTYEEKLYPIGKGWTWDIPYIKTVDKKSYLNLQSQGSYEIDFNNAEGQIKGYPFKDLTIVVDRSVTVNEEKSNVVLKSNKGINQYFTNDGRLIQIADTYGNAIQFYYSTDKVYGKVLTRIIDAIGNDIKIKYNYNEVVLTQGTKEVKYRKSTYDLIDPRPPFNPLTTELLDSVTDPKGRVTEYNYNMKDSYFNLLSDYSQSSNNNKTALLDTIVHPSGARTKYNYENSYVLRKIGKFTAMNSAYRVSNRHEMADNLVKNNVKFTYTTPNGGNSDIGSTYDQNMYTFTNVDNGLSVTTFKNQKNYISETEPTVYYLSSVTTKVGNEEQRTSNKYDETRKITTPIETSSQFFKGTASSTPSITSRTFDDYGNVLTETNPLGVTTTYTYDPKTYLLATVSGKMNASIGQYTEYARNEKGKITSISVRENNNTGKLLAKVRYEDFDDYGNAKKTVLEDDNRNIVYKTEYDQTTYNGAFPTKQIMNSTDPEGNLQQISNSFAYNKTTGQLVSSTDGKGNKTSFEYDSLDRLTKITEPSFGNSGFRYSSAEYNDVTNQVITTDEVGQKYRVRWDALGNKVEEAINNGSNYRVLNQFVYDVYNRLASSTSNNVTEQYQYDGWGQLIKASYPGGSYAEVTYNPITRVKTSQDPEGNKIQTYFDILGRDIRTEEWRDGSYKQLEAKTYDYDGNVIVHTNAFDSTNYQYDVLGRLTQVIDPLNQKQKYAYSLLGHLKQIEFPDGKLVNKEYNELGQLIVQMDETGSKEKYYYDLNGNLEHNIDKKGQTFYYTYNNGDLLTQRKSPDETVDYVYDDIGRRTSMTDNIGKTSYTYKNYTGELEKVTLPDNKAISYSYNAIGLRDSMTDPFGYQSYYIYDNRNRLEHVGSTSNSSPTSDEVSYKYLNNNLVKQVSLKNGNTSSYTYEGTRLKTLIQKTATGTEINSYTYGYDGNGNINRQSGKLGSDTFSYAYTYDKLDRIQTSSQFDETYTYTNRGNRETQTSEVIPNGLLEAKNFVYDSNNRPTSVTTENGTNVSYRYNGDGLLYERSENGNIIRYYYDGANIIAEGNVTNGTATLKARYIRGLDLVSRQGQEGSSYYLQNGHGDVTDLRDQTGNVSLNKYSYDLWGNSVTKTETVSNSFQYSGEFWDSTTKLQYLRARWYDPTVGRFISKDTYEGKIDNPLSLNLYTYVHNNPLTNVDPTGNYCVSTSGMDTHGGSCSTDQGIYLGADEDFKYHPIMSNGTIIGYLGVATMSSMPILNQNYWIIYPDDYSYIRWLAGDNDYYYSLNRETQLRLRDRKLTEYMAIQIEMGFPDFIDGFLWGRTLAKQGITSLLGVAKKGRELRGGPKAQRDNWYGYNDKAFQNWWHKQGKKEFGGNDIDDSREAKAVYDYWVSIGKPKLK